MRYLFIGAHPDDVEFSCGGTILRLVNEGHNVSLLVMTGGGASEIGDEVQRRLEQERAARFAKADLIVLGFKDGEVMANAESIGRVSALIDEIAPDFVITHYPEDSHQDHRATAAIVKSATRRRCSLLYYDSYSSMNFKANLFVNITPHVWGKKKLLRRHESQIAKYEERGIDFIKKSILINKLNGYECNASYAEGFAIDTYMM